MEQSEPTTDDGQGAAVDGEARRANRRSKKRKPKNRLKKKKTEELFLRFAPPRLNTSLRLRILQEAILWTLGWAASSCSIIIC